MAQVSYTDRNICKRAARDQGLDPDKLNFYRNFDGRWTWQKQEDADNKEVKFKQSFVESIQHIKTSEDWLKHREESRNRVYLCLSRPVKTDEIPEDLLRKLAKIAGCSLEMRDAESLEIVASYEAPARSSARNAAPAQRQPKNKMAELLDCAAGLTCAEIGVALGWDTLPGKFHLRRAAQQAGRELERVPDTVPARWRLAAVRSKKAA